MAEAQVPQENIKDDDLTEQEKWIKIRQEREEYLEKLRKWLDTARLMHFNACSGFFNNVNTTASTSTTFSTGTTPTPSTSSGNTGNSEQVQQQQQQHINNINATLAQANLWNENLQNILRQRFPTNVAANSNGVNRPYATAASPQTNQRPSTYEFVVPPLWKRMVAELMDFLILFLVKMALTFLLLESFDIIDMEFYGFESFQKNLENPAIVMPMAIEWLTLEFLHRLIVCAYETYFLKGRFFATPGKRYMGLMVITAENISPVPGRMTETISATGAAPLGWQKSLTRAAMKNLFVGLLLPLCVAFYIFPHNRTSYDMMSNSIVVEYHQEFMVYNSAV